MDMSFEVNGVKIAVETKTVNPADPTHLEIWKITTKDNKKLELRFCFGVQAFGLGIDEYFDSMDSPEFEAFLKRMTGLNLGHVMTTYDKKVEAYYSDPMGCPEDYI